MKKILFTLAALALIVASCAKNEADMPQPIAQQGRTVTVSVPDQGAPARAPIARTALEQQGKKIIVKWKAGDKIDLYFRQFRNGEQAPYLAKVAGVQLTIVPGTDDKKATFNIPATVNNIDLDVPYTLCGVHGTGGATGNEEIWVDVSQIYTSDLATFNVPMYFKVEVSPGSPVPSIAFTHLGALQVVHIKNTSSASKQIMAAAPYASSIWHYYSPMDGYAPRYDLIGGTVRENGNDPSASFSAITIPAGETRTVASWVMPNEVEQVPAIQLWIKLAATTFAYSTNIRPERPALQKGNAYHLYAEWDGANFKLVEPPATMTMTTTKAIGESISLAISALPADQADCWIDLNNNGTKDTGEEVKEFGIYLKSYTLGAQTVTVYGKVTAFRCYTNQLNALDVSGNTALIVLWCGDNQLQELDVSKNTALIDLNFNYNQLQELDVSKNTALTGLSFFNNKISQLDVSKNTALKELYCEYNQLQELDVSKNTALTGLSCFNNKISQLDVSKNTALTGLSCEYNQLQELDVSKNTALTKLWCGMNQLQELDVSKNTALTNLSCSYNNINGTNMTVLVNSLPTRPSSAKGKLYPKGGSNVFDASHQSIAAGKNWIVVWN